MYLRFSRLLQRARKRAHRCVRLYDARARGDIPLFTMYPARAVYDGGARHVFGRVSELKMVIWRISFGDRQVAGET